MKITTLMIAAAALLPGTLSGQTGIRPPQGWSLGITGGAAAFSDLQRGSVHVERPTDIGIEQRELARRVSAETSTALGAYVSFWPSRNWGLRLQGTWSPTRFETLMKESEAEFAGLPPSSEEAEPLAGLSIMTGDLQALFRLPTIKNRVMLYGIVGGGLARYELKQGEGDVPPEAEGEFDGGAELHPAGVVGLGSMLPLRNRAFRMHFELTSHFGRTPLRGGESVTTESPTAEVEIDPRDEPAGERRVTITNSVRFMVGLSWSP